MTDLAVIDSQPVDPDVIERLEEALAEAREGRISSVAIAVVYRSGVTAGSWSSPPAIGTLIGSVSLLHHALCANHTDKD